MKLLPLILIAFLSGCFGLEVETKVHLTEMENCLHQEGEWTGSACRFEGEICLTKAQCKMGGENCPCIEWGYGEQHD